MPAAYDTYDYPSYWDKREYEHKAEYYAIKTLLNKIPHIKTIIEIGAGYGRLFSSFSYRAKKIILSDPSASSLSLARKKIRNNKQVCCWRNKKAIFVQSSLENLPNQIKSETSDLVIMVRVLHHIEDTQEAFKIVAKLLKDNGYFILEFANKGHIKATLKEFYKGNITFPLDIFPIDKRSKKTKKAKTLPFINYHPDEITEQLRNAGFTIVEKLSVSNIRSTFLKKIITTATLIDIEKALQKPLSHINFGPSIFILAKKHPIT
ncbi:MAG: class I SAM-dependent methyltransferase [Candidatus Woesebacteria bacterium]|nr:class I SAM-dependent methyltransferase [Candidatus Woesebacteria bacterium]